MDKKEKINKLVHELDRLFSNGIGHVNIDCENNNETLISLENYNECAEGKNACGIPTEHFSDDE